MNATAAPATDRRRFRLIVIAAFALANVGAWLGYHHFFGPHRQRLLRVDRFSPGDAATVAARPQLEWQFNLDVAPDPSGAAPAQIQPAVPGKWQWRGARTLLFQPDQDLPKATRFVVTIPPDRMRTPEGFGLPGAFVASIGTAPLHVVDVRQRGMLEDRRFILELEFDDAVIPADLTTKLKLQDPEGKPLNFTRHGDAVGKTVRVLTDSVHTSAAPEIGPVELSVRVEAGLAGVGGPLGLDQPYETRVQVDSVLAATGATASAGGRGKPELHLAFNNAVDPQLLREVLSIDPPVPFVINRGYNGITLEGDFKPASRYALKLAAAPKGADPTRYPRPDMLSVFVPDRAPGVWFEHEAGYLGAQGNRTLLAHAVNLSELRVRVWCVYDGNVVEWRNANGRYSWRGADPRGYAKPVATKTIRVKSDRNVIHDVRLALDDLLPPGAAADGVFRVGIVPTSGTPNTDDDDGDDASRGDGAYESATALITLSDTALSAKREPHGLTVWATSLSTARPLDRVRVRAYSNKNQLLGEALTNADGLATIRELHPAEGETPAVILADRSNAATTQATSKPANAPAPYGGLTWMDLRNTAWDLSDADVAGRPYPRTGHEAFVYADRGVYRPGETVRLRAILRRGDGKPPQAMPVRWLIRRPDLREWKQLLATADADGSAALDLALPDDLTTGRWTAEIGLPGEPTAASTFGRQSFLVEEFVPNRLKVGLNFAGRLVSKAGAADQRATAGAHPLLAVVQGDYLFGRPAAGLQSALTARLDPSPFAPREWSGWSFGDHASLLDAATTAAPGVLRTNPSGRTARGSANANPDLPARALDDKGRVEFQIDLTRFRAVTPATRPATSQPAAAPQQYRGPWVLAVETTVQEPAGRTVSAAASIQVDALPWYIGLRSTSSNIPAPNTPATFEIALISPTGQVAPAADAAPLEISLLRESWNNSLTFRDGSYHYQSHRVLDPVPSAHQQIRPTAGRAKFSVTPPGSGAYILCVRDPAHGAMTAIQFHASDGTPWEDNISREHPERLEIVILPPESPFSRDPQGSAPAALQIPSKSTTLKVGQTARVLIRSPFAGRLLFTVETDHVLSTRVIDMPASSVELPVEVAEALRPNAYVTASVVRAVDPNAKWRTHRAHGTARLSVDPADARLAIAFDTPPEIRPLSTLDVSLRVTDAAGRPVANAPVTLAAVDEGVLVLTGFRTPDPLPFFHAPRALAVDSLDIFGQLMPEVPRPDKVSPVGGDGGTEAPGRHQSPVTARRIRPVALVATLRTDDRGVAVGNLPIPEFAGQLRLMAVAHSGNRYGSGEQQLFVRSPLIVQSTFPRFAAPGDRFAVPVTLFNNSKADAQVALKAEFVGSDDDTLLALADSPARELTLPPIAIPAGGQQTLSLPMAAGKSVGVARLRLTAAAGAETSVESTELPIRPASPFVTRGGFSIVAPDKPADLQLADDFLPGTERARVALSPLPALQLPDGLEYLDRYPYGCAEQTISTCFPLLYLSDIGPRIAPGMFEKRRVDDKIQSGINRLLGMQTADGGLSMWPGHNLTWPWTSVYAAHFLTEARTAGHAVPADFQKRLLAYVRTVLDKPGDAGDLLELQAYAAYVLALNGKPDRGYMSRLGELAKSNATGPDHAAARGQARLHLALAWQAAGRSDLAAASLPNVLPTMRDKYQTGGNIGSPVRDRAIYLTALLTLAPENPAIPELARQLSAAKWQGTQDTAFATMAIGKYLRSINDQEPYDHADLLVDGAPIPSIAGALSWTKLPSGVVTSGDHAAPSPKILAKITGPRSSRGYLTWVRTGVPRQAPANEDHGVTIRRRYLDEHSDPIKPNQVQTGDLVLVELTIESASAQENLVVEDLLPAGLEIENARLQTTASLVRDRRQAKAAQDEPAELSGARLDPRDDRMVIFGHLAAGGVARHVYAARAVVPGVYALPPARVESMYDPATNSLWSPGGALEVRPLDRKSIVGVPTGE